MNDKQQIEIKHGGEAMLDLLNQEQAELQKVMIEEMAKWLDELWTDYPPTPTEVAEVLVKNNIAKLPGNAVGLTKEEFERLMIANENFERLKETYKDAVESEVEFRITAEVMRERVETAREIIVKIFSYIGSQQQFCIVDDGHKTLIDCDKLFEFVGNLVKQYGVEIKE